MKNYYLALLLIFVLSAFGCSQFRDAADGPGDTGNTGGSEPEIAKDTGPAPPEYEPTNDPKADIEKMSERFLGVTSFKAKMTGDGKTPVNSEMDFIAPDRYRVKTASAMEMIVIGRATFMKIGEEWRLMQLPLDPSIKDMRAAFGKDEMKWVSDVKFGGEEPVNGKWAYVYTYHAKGPNNQGENDSKLWVAKSSGLPLKIEATYKSGNLKTMTIDYDYDTPVVIQPPARAVPATGGYQ